MAVSITIIGTGYVGLVSGVCFAALGHDVICVDKDPEKIAMLRRGEMPIYEPGLADLLDEGVRSGRLSFTTDIEESCKDCDAVFIAVGTPTTEGSDSADLTFVMDAARQIAGAVTGFTTIVTKSTVPVGTNAEIYRATRAELERLGSTAKIAVVSNPEFLREGAAIDDFMRPDRIVVGVADRRAATIMREIYEPLTAPVMAGGPGAKYLEVGLQTAEMIKYASNAFLAVKISYINEMANLCEKVHADVEKVALGMGLDQRIGKDFLKTGPGWGGSCFPKDTRALADTARKSGLEMRIVDAAVAVNNDRSNDMVKKIIADCDGSVRGKTIAILGLTFKGQTDDMREAVSLKVLPELMRKGARIQAFDPAKPAEAAELLPGVDIFLTPREACKNAEALVVMTDWAEFLDYDLTLLSSVMKSPTMTDLRNLFDGQRVLDAGFWEYSSLGRPTLADEPALSVAAE
jgi:UDPglucose 6-dehydrogenase